MEFILLIGGIAVLFLLLNSSGKNIELKQKNEILEVMITNTNNINDRLIEENNQLKETINKIKSVITIKRIEDMEDKCTSIIDKIEESNKEFKKHE